MTLDVIGVFRDALARWRRDRGLLLPIAGTFFFLPSLAVNLLVPDRPAVALDPEMSQLQRTEAVRPLAEWLVANAPVFLLSELVAVFGALVVLVLYLGPVRATVGDALRRAIALMPRFFVLMLIAGLPVSIGLLTIVLLLPALYLIGRLYVAGAVLVAEPPPRIGHALPRSFALTRGNGFALAGMVTLVLLVSLVSWPIDSLAGYVVEHHAANPVAMVILAALSAAVSSVSLLAMPLLQVSTYRSLLARKGA